MLNGHIIAEPHEQPTRLRVLEIVPATVEHVYELAETLRDADRREILNLGINVKKALWRAFRNSIMCRTALLDAKVAAIWGLGVGLHAGVSPLSDLGAPWLLTSAAVEALPIAMVKLAKLELAVMRRARSRLEIFVAADYPQAIKLARLLDFAVEQPEPVGLGGALYCRCHIGFDA